MIQQEVLMEKRANGFEEERDAVTTGMFLSCLGC